MKSEPRERPLDHPAPGQDLESFLPLTTLDHLQPQLAARAQVSHPLWQPRSLVDRIRPDQAQAAEAGTHLREHAPSPVVILRAGRMDDRHQHKPEHVNEQMSFPASHLLASVEAALAAPAVGRLDALRIEDRRRGLRFTPFGLTHQRAQAVVEALPEAAQAPPPEVAVDGLPRRVLARQIAPGAARAVEVE